MAHGAVEAVVAEWLEVLGVSPHVTDAARLVLFQSAGVGQQLPGDINTDNGRTEVGKQPGVATLAARDREHVLLANIADQLFQGRVPETVALRINGSWYAWAFSS